MQIRFIFLAFIMLFIPHFAHAALEDDWSVESIRFQTYGTEKVYYKVITNLENKKTLVINVEETMQDKDSDMAFFLHNLIGFYSKHINPLEYEIHQSHLLKMLLNLTKPESPVETPGQALDNHFRFGTVNYLTFAGIKIQDLYAIVFFTPNFKEIDTNQYAFQTLQNTFHDAGFNIKIFLQGANPFFE